MAIHPHLARIPKRQFREVGWTKAMELVNVARREPPLLSREYLPDPHDLCISSAGDARS